MKKCLSVLTVESWEGSHPQTPSRLIFLLCPFCILLSGHFHSRSYQEHMGGHLQQGHLVKEEVHFTPQLVGICLLSSPFDVDVTHILPCDALLIQNDVLGVPDDDTQEVPGTQRILEECCFWSWTESALQGTRVLGLLTSWLSWEWCWKGGLVVLNFWGRHPPTSEVSPKPYTEERRRESHMGETTVFLFFWQRWAWTPGLPTCYESPLPLSYKIISSIPFLKRNHFCGLADLLLHMEGCNGERANQG